MSGFRMGWQRHRDPGTRTRSWWRTPRQHEEERSALSRLARHRNLPAHGHGDLSNNPETQTEATVLAIGDRPLEPAEDDALLFEGNSDSVVTHRERCSALGRRCLELDRIAPTILQRVGDQVAENLVETKPIPAPQDGPFDA